MVAHSWDDFAGRVDDRFRVLALTARGHGDSDRAAEYGVMQHIADTAAFIDEVAGGAAIVCGLSMGGGTAIGLAALHEAKVSKLVIVEAGPSDPKGERLASRMCWRTQRSRGAAMPRYYPHITRRLSMFRTTRSWPTCRTHFAATPMAGCAARWIPPSSRRRCGAAAADTDSDALLWAACAAIKCPTLIVRGSRSDVLTRDGAERMASAIADARFVEVDAGHAVPFENPDGFYDAVRGFL